MRQVNEGFLNRLAAVVSPDALVHDPAELLTYEADALVHLRATPRAVVLPRSASEVQAGYATKPGCRSSLVDMGPASRAAHCRTPTAS
jgi:hypothetical protein